MVSVRKMVKSTLVRVFTECTKLKKLRRNFGQYSRHGKPKMANFLQRHMIDQIGKRLQAPLKIMLQINTPRDDYTRIVFDSETTGRKNNCYIVEIACWKVQDKMPDDYCAHFESRDDVFYSLILPSKRMNARASKVNGIKKAAEN